MQYWIFNYYFCTVLSVSIHSIPNISRI